MLNPALNFLCLGTPVIVASLYITCIVTKNLYISIVSISQPVLKLLQCWWVLTKKSTTGKEITPLAVVLVAFDAIENKERVHLVIEKTPIMVMEEMSAPFFWTVLSSLDVIQIADATREQPRIRIAVHRLCGVVFAFGDMIESELSTFGILIPITRMAHAYTYDIADSWSIGGKYIIFDV